MEVDDCQVFSAEVLATGIHANGFGEVGDGRSFAFRIESSTLGVQIYRAHRTEIVPDAKDVVATASRAVTEIDVTDERSIIAAVRDLVAEAQPTPASGRVARLLAD